MTPKSQLRVVLGVQLVAEGVCHTIKNHFLHLLLAAGTPPPPVPESHLLLSVFEMLSSVENLRKGKSTKLKGVRESIICHLLLIGVLAKVSPFYPKLAL